MNSTSQVPDDDSERALHATGSRVIESQSRKMPREPAMMADVLETIASADDAVTADRLDAIFLLNALAVGGSERKTVRLVNHLTRRNMRVGLASLNGPDTLAPMIDSSVAHWRLNRRGKFSIPVVQALSSIIRAQRPRVLFCVNLYPALYGAVVAAAVGAGRPAIVALVNTTDFGPGERWRQPFYRQILKRFDWTVYGCEIQREQWIGRSDRSRTRTQVIYNGVDVAEFSVDSLAAERSALREHASYAGDPFIIGSVGHLNAAKNHRVLIDSIAQLRRDGIDARLIIVGEGPLRAALERQAADRGVLEVVTFTGAIQDVRRTLAILDVFVLPSLYVETFSNAALEAMAMNTPVILSRVGGAAEMIEDGKTGFLVDPHELHERLPKLLAQLARNPGTRRELGARARQHVERDFSLQNMVQRYEDLIQRVGR